MAELASRPSEPAARGQSSFLDALSTVASRHSRGRVHAEPASAPAPLRRRSRRAGLALAAVAILALAACGDDSDNGDDSQSDTTEEPTPSTTTTQPSATDDEEAAFAIVEDIFYERRELLDEVHQNPELIEDDDHLDRIRGLVTGDLEGIDELIDAAQERLDDGHHLEATADAMSDWGIYRLETIDEDTITFEHCQMGDNRLVDADGEPVGEPTVFGTFGPGEATRVDGVWRLSKVESWGEDALTEDDLSPGYLFQGFCDLEFGSQPTSETEEQ